MRHLGLLIIALSVSGCATIPPAEVPPPSPSQRQAVVFDIDGTLTPKNMAVYEPRPGAAEAIRAFSAKGYKIIYLSARNPLYQAGLPNWLRQNGFPEGILHVAQSGEERDQVDRYKARILTAYLLRGWRLAYAYGDSSTDFTAYAEAGIPRERVFGLKRKDSKDCQPGVYLTCLAGWTEHLPYIERDIASVK
jgi:phosphoserine phosphatase